MKKRAYKATRITQIHPVELAGSLQDERVIVGVDVAKEVPVAAFMKTDGEVVRTVKWKHPSQTRRFVQLLVTIGTQRVELVMEPTGTYGDPLVHLAASQGVCVFMARPKVVKDMKEIYDGVPSKHDGKDAAVVAELHRIGKAGQWYQNSEEQRRVRALLSLADIHRDQLVANLNRLEARLATHWPELTGILSIDSASLLALLGNYGGPKQVAQDPEGVTRLIRRTSRAGISLDRVSHLLSAARETTGLPMLEEENDALRALALEAERNRNELNRAENRVRKLCEESEAMNNMADKIGLLTAAVVVGYLGAPDQYDSPHAYVKAAGLNMKIHQSGRDKYANKRLRITKRGPGTVRKYLYLAVLRLIQHDPIFKSYYARKVGRDGGIKGKAIVALMRKLMCGLWHAGRGNEFDSTLLFDVSRLGLSELHAT